MNLSIQKMFEDIWKKIQSNLNEKNFELETTVRSFSLEDNAQKIMKKW